MCAQSESRPPVQFALFHNLLSCGTNINAGSRSAPRASHQLLSSQLPEFPPQPLGCCCRDCQLFPQPLRLINPAPQRFSQPLQSQAPTYRRATCHKKGSHRWKKKQRKNTLKHRHRRNVTSHHFTSLLFTSFHFYVFCNFFGSYQSRGK